MAGWSEYKSNSASQTIKVGSGAWAELGKIMPTFQHSVLVFDVQSIVDTFDRCSINEVITHIFLYQQAPTFCHEF